MSKIVNFTCPACGFITFNMPSDVYEFCGVCKWQDDRVQQQKVASRIGANKASLCEYQSLVLKKYPLEVKEVNGFKRNNSWCPLTTVDCHQKERKPQTGKEYFDNSRGEMLHYFDKENLK